MTKDELIELAQVGMDIHSPDAPEYIVCEALIEALTKSKQCNHRIADARNKVIKDGYICVDCGSLFSAADHNEPQPEPWEKFCDSNCVWTDHHPDCKLAQKRCTPNCEALLEKIVLQRKPLTIKQLNLIGAPMHFNLLSAKDKADLFAFARAIEEAHGIKVET